MLRVRLALAYASLLRWLGPWSAPTRAPAGIARKTITIPRAQAGDRDFDAWLYAPRRAPIGAFLVCPGLHYAGPADPRFDRFARILANAGILVLAPFLPDFLALRVDPRLANDLDRAFATLLELPELARLRASGRRPGLFSISFGSLPTLRLAASAKRRDQIGAAVIFGGYADWSRTIRFCLGDAGNRRRDPLNQPVVLMNLIDDLPDRPSDPTPVLAAWRKYVESTWGRPEMKEPARWRPVAEAIAATLPESHQPLFRLGVGLDEGALALAERALEKSAPKIAYLDPLPDLANIRCPIVLCHGADDDVIPHTELDTLRAALPATIETRAYVTGLYHHTGAATLASVLSNVRALAKESRAMIGILRALVRCGRMP